jgi:hypothetical protein
MQQKLFNPPIKQELDKLVDVLQLQRHLLQRHLL